jgi:isocitrate dehydrogenase
MTADITVAYGDGIGPEIMQATLKILAQARADINIETIEVGEAYYKKGVSTGIPPSAWESLHRTKVLLKAPITTPQGGGYKSLNVTMRKTLGLYANVRPCVTYHPYVSGLHDTMDLVIIRENEEDLYSGIEYQQTAGSVHGIKLITRAGCERINRYAFEYARQNGRKKVTCMVKDNIMKMADGLFYKVFLEIGEEYPEIEKARYIVDIGSARIASRPQEFDVIVTENLYGDIISDIAAEVCGSVGLAGSANIGIDFAMFEAIHGSAPDIAGQNIANPSGLLNGAIMMLVHLGQGKVASTIKNAWLRTIEDGIHTGDIYTPKSKQCVGTQEFADAVIARLGQNPTHFEIADYPDTPAEKIKEATSPGAIKVKKELKGVDVFIEWLEEPANLGEKLLPLVNDNVELKLISAKGLKIWPDCDVACSKTDTMRCRFVGKGGNTITQDDIISLLAHIADARLDILKTENLYYFDGERGYTLCQGE